MSDIWNAGLAKERLKALNDEINALLKSKHAWEKRIVELGGPDYTSKIDSDEYQYFGAAKNLAEVKQMYEKEMPAAPQEAGPWPATAGNLCT